MSSSLFNVSTSSASSALRRASPVSFVSTTVVSIGEEVDEDDILDKEMYMMDKDSPHLFDSLNCMNALRGEYRMTVVDSRKATFTEQYGRELEMRKKSAATTSLVKEGSTGGVEATSSMLPFFSPASMTPTEATSTSGSITSPPSFVDSSGRIRFHVVLSGVPLVLSTNLAATLGGSTPPHLLSLSAALDAMQRSRNFVICRPCIAEPDDDTAVIIYTKDMLEYLASKERDAVSNFASGNDSKSNSSSSSSSMSLKKVEQASSANSSSSSSSSSSSFSSSSSSSSSTSSLSSSSAGEVAATHTQALQHVSLACSFYRHTLLPDCHWGREPRRWLSLDELQDLFNTWWEARWEVEQQKLAVEEKGRLEHRRESPEGRASSSSTPAAAAVASSTPTESSSGVAKRRRIEIEVGELAALKDGSSPPIPTTSATPGISAAARKDGNAIKDASKRLSSSVTASSVSRLGSSVQSISYASAHPLVRSTMPASGVVSPLSVLSKKRSYGSDTSAIFHSVRNTLVRIGLLFGRVEAKSFWFGVPDSGLLWTHLTAGKAEIVGKIKSRRYQELPRKEAEGLNLTKTCLPSAFIIKHLLGTGTIRCVQTASGAFLKLPQ